MSTPKTPRKDPNTVRLERQQLQSLNKQKAEAASSIALRRKRIKDNSLGRRSLLRLGERGIEDIQSQAKATLPTSGIPITGINDPNLPTINAVGG